MKKMMKTEGYSALYTPLLPLSIYKWATIGPPVKSGSNGRHWLADYALRWYAGLGVISPVARFYDVSAAEQVGLKHFLHTRLEFYRYLYPCEVFLSHIPHTNPWER